MGKILVYLFWFIVGICVLLSTGIHWIIIVIHLYRKSVKDHKEHPERYMNREPDNFIYETGNESHWMSHD